MEPSKYMTPNFIKQVKAKLQEYADKFKEQKSDISDSASASSEYDEEKSSNEENFDPFREESDIETASSEDDDNDSNLNKLYDKPPSGNSNAITEWAMKLGEKEKKNQLKKAYKKYANNNNN